MARQDTNNTAADLADLRGAWLVMTSETEEGQRLATRKLKRIMQGMGRNKATRKDENPIEFPETHKLWIDANHLPRVHETDDAIWNRLCPIPFRRRFAKTDQDPKLPKKLLAEAEGVLAWAVKGARQWYENSLKRVGLGKPSEVEKAPKEWRVESDPVGPFIADRCTKEDDLRVQASKALAGSHDDTVLALAIAWQGVAGHARRKNATDFFQSVMAVNLSLSGNSHRDARDERTPSDFPEGGSRSVTTGNPFNPSRWSH